MTWENFLSLPFIACLQDGKGFTLTKLCTEVQFWACQRNKSNQRRKSKNKSRWAESSNILPVHDRPVEENTWLLWGSFGSSTEMCVLSEWPHGHMKSKHRLVLIAANGSLWCRLGFVLNQNWYLTAGGCEPRYWGTWMKQKLPTLPPEEGPIV